MKRVLTVFAALLAVSSLTCCVPDDDIQLDSPFVYIADGTGASYSDISKDADKLLSELTVTLSISPSKFTTPIQVYYEAYVGDGLREGTDFSIQPACASPLTFEPGNYSLPIRILWLRNPAFNPDKDNTLKLKLSGSSMAGMKLGYPGPDNYKSTFTFTRK